MTMESSRQVSGTLVRLAVVALLATPIAGAASQSSGNGYMFRKPAGSLSVRGGYELANTSSQPFTVMRSQTTIGPRSFDALHLGLDLGVFATRKLDVVFSADVSSRNTTAEYREWEENGQPIEHWSGLDRLSLGGSLKYNFVDRGRSISALAWIPTRYVPYVGVGGGYMWYVLIQKGDFVEETAQQTAAIYTDELRSSSGSAMAHVFSGLDYRINARWSLLGEARYTQSSAKLVDDYAGLGKIELSGLALSIGTSLRF